MSFLDDPIDLPLPPLQVDTNIVPEFARGNSRESDRSSQESSNQGYYSGGAPSVIIDHCYTRCPSDRSLYGESYSKRSSTSSDRTTPHSPFSTEESSSSGYSPASVTHDSIEDMPVESFETLDPTALFGSKDAYITLDNGMDVDVTLLLHGKLGLLLTAKFC